MFCGDGKFQCTSHSSLSKFVCSEKFSSEYMACCIGSAVENLKQASQKILNVTWWHPEHWVILSPCKRLAEANAMIMVT